MKTLLLSALVTSTLLTMNTEAIAAQGNSSGGGGNALVCFNTPTIPTQIRERDSKGAIIDGSIRNEHISHITRVEILDLVEAKFSKGIKDPKSYELISIKAEESISEYTERILGRIKNVAPIVYDKFMETLKAMPEDEAVGQPEGLYPVNDYNLLGKIDSTNCVVATVAIHQFANGTISINYDQRLMAHPRHSDMSKAVTYFHEVVYATARKWGQTDSQNTRKLVSLLLRKDVSVEDLAKTLKNTSFDTTVWNASMYYKFHLSGRSDRLGYVYQQLNAETFSVLNTMDSKYRDEIKKLSEGYKKVDNAEQAKKIKNTMPSLQCEDVNSCDKQLIEIRNSRFASKAKKELAQKIISEYFYYHNEVEARSMDKARIKILTAKKEELRSFYENKYEALFLAVSNIPSEDLRRVTQAIESEIENNFEKIVARLNNYYNKKSLSSIPELNDYYSDSAPTTIFKDIPEQTKL